MATESKLVSPSRAALFTVTVPSQKFLQSSRGSCRFGRVSVSVLSTFATQQIDVRTQQTQQTRVDVYEKAVWTRPKLPPLSLALPITRVAKDFPRPLVTCERSANHSAPRIFERWAFQRGSSVGDVIADGEAIWREGRFNTRPMNDGAIKLN